MDRLIEGHKRFLKEVFPAKKSQYRLLADRQAPEWLFIT
jgi:carbonic anhydrase